MIVFIHGEDTYSSRAYLGALLARYAEKYGNNAPIERLNTDEHTWEQIAASLTAGGLFSEKKCVVLENIFSNPDIRANMQDYLDTQQVHEDITCIILEGGKLDKRTSLAKTLLKEKYVNEFTPPDEHKMQQLITQHVGLSKGDIDPHATNLLAQAIGSDTHRMHAEVEKLVHGVTGIIQHTHVQSLTHVRTEDAIWDFVDALTSRDKKKVLQLLEQEFEASIEPVYLLSMLVRQLRLLLALRDVQGTDAVLAKELSLHPFVVKKTRQQAVRFSSQQLLVIHQALGRLDRAIKSGKGDPKVLFTLLLDSVVR